MDERILVKLQEVTQLDSEYREHIKEGIRLKRLLGPNPINKEPLAAQSRLYLTAYAKHQAARSDFKQLCDEIYPEIFELYGDEVRDAESLNYW
jgi:hypothetical protein